MKLSSLIVDDEPYAGELIASHVLKNDYLELIGIETNPKKALQKIASGELCPDLIFLDVEMPGYTGFEFVKEIQTEDDPLFILTTAHRNYGPEAFAINAVDYLLKPVSYELFSRSINKIISRLTVQPEKEDVKLPYIFINGNGKYDLIKIHKQEILWIEGASAYTRIKTEKKDYLSTSKLKKMENLLGSPPFIRIQKSYIVNLDHVTAVNTYEVTLDNSVQLPVGENYREGLFTLLNKYRPG